MSELDMQTEEQVLERIVRNKMQIEELLAENATLTDYFRERNDQYPAGTKKSVGKFYIRVTKNARIDDTLARKVLTSKEYDLVSKKVVDTARAKRYLLPSVIEKITKTYENRIEIGLN